MAPETIMVWYINSSPNDHTDTDPVTGGGNRSAYVLRITGSADFKYDSGIDMLLGLPLDELCPRTMRFATMTGNEVVDVEDEGSYSDQRQARFMRLAALINLETRVSVWCYYPIVRALQISLTRSRSAALVQC